MTTIATRESEAPAYGAAFTVEEIKRRNREAGGHYFDADTMRFFGSRVLPTVVGGRFFVTSERTGFDWDSPRAYSVREMMPDGTIGTVGEFNEHPTSAAAKSAMRRLARERHTYYFDGQHGKGGRKVCYVVTADDPWAAMERLHANFRVFHCGRAYDWMLGERRDQYTHLEA